MPRHPVLAAIAFILGFAPPAAAQPGGFLFDDPNVRQVQFGQDTGPTAETDSAHPNFASLQPPTAVNQLGYNWWFYRVKGDSVNRPFGVYTKSDGFSISGTSNYSASHSLTVTYNWTENGATGPRFTASDAITLEHPSPTDTFFSSVRQDFQINNSTSSSLEVLLFNVNAPAPGNHTAGVTGAGNANSMAFTDGSYTVTDAAPGASSYEVARGTSFPLPFGTPASDFNNSGLPYSGVSGQYAAAGFEWDLVVPPSGSSDVSLIITSDHAVPEPGSLLLVAFSAAAGAVFGRRVPYPRLGVRPSGNWLI
jgi:hypothetical protein